MPSFRTRRTHTARTAREIQTTVGGGSIQYPVTVPAGTLCHKLDGGSQPWVVEDLSWMDRERQGIAHHDAMHYGIRVDEADLVDIQPLDHWRLRYL